MYPLTVLLVEDNHLLRWWMTSSLQREGCSVFAPKSVDEAMDLAALSAFDVLITDWRLADGRNGLEILNRVRQKHPRTVAVLISAEACTPCALSLEPRDGPQAYETLSDRARAIGFDMVIEKPFPVAEIVGAVRQLATRHEPEVAS